MTDSSRPSKIRLSYITKNVYACGKDKNLYILYKNRDKYQICKAEIEIIQHIDEVDTLAEAKEYLADL